MNRTVSAAVISEVLKGLDFPAGKQKCIDHARKRDPPKEVMEALERMPGAGSKDSLDKNKAEAPVRRF